VDHFPGHAFLKHLLQVLEGTQVDLDPKQRFKCLLEAQLVVTSMARARLKISQQVNVAV
jgi:hypothetical protein